MNSSILKVFEQKLSIFTQLQHASYSRILNIMLIFCCKVTLKKHTLNDEKDAEFAFHFFVANLSDNAVVLNANSFQVLFRDIVYFSTTFSQNIFQNPQIRLRETETKHLKKAYFFSHVRPQGFHVILKARIF